MAGWEFWAVALALAGAVATVLVTALRRARADGTRSTAEADLAVYKDQLAEIERDAARGTIGLDEAGRLRAEVGKRVLEADRARAGGNAGADQHDGRSKLAVTLVLLLVSATFLVYAGSASILRGIGLQEDRIATLSDELSFEIRFRGVNVPKMSLVFEGIGAPGYPDMALRPRLAALDEAIAARPGQEAELARLGRTRDAALDAKLSAELAALSDPEALRARFRRDFETGETQTSVRVQERLLAVLGEGSASNDHANLALALVVEAQGYVSPEAEAQLREALRRDMGNELARYLVGEMFLQGGRFDQAFRFWRPIAEGGSPSAPWVTSIRERIETVAGLAGVRYTLPEATGPSAEDVAAAEEMSPEDQQAMIEGMVAQLSERLASGGGPVEDWVQLIRSLGVLGRTDEAQAIYDEAKAKFAGRAAELQALEAVAGQAGITP